MLNKRSFIILLIVLFISILVFIIFNDYKQETKISSQRIEEKDTTKENKIILRLESALDIIEENNEKSHELAKSCLLESQKIGNKYLEMRSLYVLGRGIINVDSLKVSQTYFDKALKLSQEIEDNWYIGDILYRIAKIQYRLNNTKLSLETYNEALYYCQLSNNFKTIGATYSMIGTIFRVNGAYSRAIEYFIKSRLNYRKANFSEGDAWVAYLLGQIHSDLLNSEKAMQYFQESLSKYEVLNSIDGNTNGIAICYEQIALLNLELKNFDEASRYINMLLEIRIKNKSTYGISNAYGLLGKSAYLKGNYIKAESLLNKSLEIKNGNLSLHSKPSVFMYLGLCAIKTGDLDGGIKKIKKGLKIASVNNFKKNELEIYSKLAEIYLNNNNFKEAIFYKDKQIELQDLILFGEADVQIDLLQTFYEIDEKNRLINELKKENVVNVLKIKEQRLSQNLMIFVILIVILIAIIIYVFYTKLRRKNGELKILNRTTNKLFSIIAHDLRSPLSTILGFSDLLKNNGKDLETRKIVKFSDYINSTAVNTLALLDNLLNWAKSQTGQISFNPVKLDLQAIITKTIEDLNPTAKLKNIILKNINIEGIEVYADQYMLKTILLNLITNAIKFTNLKGKITVNAIHKNDLVEIIVSDDGIGMNEESRNKLFTLQTNGTTIGTAKEKGSGLGLVLCKELVEKHGGTIWVTSELNKGATFHFTLPDCIVENINEHNCLSTNLKTKEIKTPTILIVEDEEINYKYLEAIMENGFNLVYAFNGKEGVEQFKNNNIDLILMDIKMPIMDGIEATKEIRKINKEIPIIAVTAYVTSKDIALKTGCNDFISKPVDENKLLEMISNQLKEK
ncbi:ATP-binding protein [Lutibacter citreus]|uniref:ATP-binding protein n=1 Tax=Lutibacter citreus TaxID=2138210 RepID=UPI000DBE0D1B|nr:ATP-binding protein [Lutibacter citreus]